MNSRQTNVSGLDVFFDSRVGCDKGFGKYWRPSQHYDSPAHIDAHIDTTHNARADTHTHATHNIDTHTYTTHNIGMHTHTTHNARPTLRIHMRVCMQREQVSAPLVGARCLVWSSEVTCG